MLETKKTDKLYFQNFKWIMVVWFGIVFRYLFMHFGHNFDFDSYYLVGEISRHFGNVYAETSRYNYGCIFYLVQATAYNLSCLIFENGTMMVDLYRFLIVSFLTFVDLGIMLVLKLKYGDKAAIIFFLNPVSIYITGYHNQFDNFAIFLMLLGTFFYNEDEKITKKDVMFIIFFALSLITKHIFFVLPIWILLKKGLPFKKKIIYAFVPPFLFLSSFIPFLGSKEAIIGIINNVFLYRSFNNFPLLYWILSKLQVPSNAYFIIFVLCMIAAGFIVGRAEKNNISEMIFIYTIVLVTFSSAVADQYLIIPVAALCCLAGWEKYAYIGWGGLVLWGGICSPLSAKFASFMNYEFIRYTIPCLILLVFVIKYVIFTGKNTYREKSIRGT